ncbi:MAG: diguanylate cyclase [Cyanobacteria bacterium J06626_23]
MAAPTILSAVVPAPLLLTPQTPLTDAIAAMTNAGTSFTLIQHQDQLAGIFTERDVVRLISQQVDLNGLALAEVMTPDVITLKEEELSDVFQVSRRFRQHGVRHLPVVNAAGDVIGVITPQSVRDLIRPEHLLRHMRTAEVMVRETLTAVPGTPVLALAQQMATCKVSCIVIVAPTAQQPLGIVTERDVVQLRALGLDLAITPAQTVMSTPLSTVSPEDSLWQVHQRMQAMHVRRLVVTHPEGSLAGIVTQTQMLAMLDPVEMLQVMQQMQRLIDRQTLELENLNRQLEADNLQLAQLATMDELTQLVNRRSLKAHLDCMWHQLSPTSQPLTLIFCDIDDFKRYNDTYGHVAGDACLVSIAQMLQRTVRKSDVVARYGGEEFVIVLSGTDATGSERVAQALLQQTQELAIPHRTSSVAEYVTISLGCLTVVPSPALSWQSLLQVADQLLYEAKSAGRNTYRSKVLQAQPFDVGNTPQPLHKGT